MMMMMMTIWVKMCTTKQKKTTTSTTEMKTSFSPSFKNTQSSSLMSVVRRTRQTSMFFRYVTDTNQSESHSGLKQIHFTRNYMGAWRT